MNGRFFYTLAKVRLGRDAEVASELDAAVRDGWVGIAVKMTAASPRVHPDQANYWVALDKLLGMCASRGLSVDCILFGDDVKRTMPDAAHRKAFVTRTHEFLQGRPGVDIVLMDMTPQALAHAPSPSIDPFFDGLDEISRGLRGFVLLVKIVTFVIAGVVIWWFVRGRIS